MNMIVIVTVKTNDNRHMKGGKFVKVNKINILKVTSYKNVHV